MIRFVVQAAAVSSPVAHPPFPPASKQARAWSDGSTSIAFLVRHLSARSAGATGAVLLTLLAGGAPASAKAPGLGCRSGTLLFVDGPLRIVAVPFSGRDGRGNEEYACLGARGKPLGVGSTFVGTGVASGTTPQFVFDGARYLAALQYSDTACAGAALGQRASGVPHR